MHLTLIVLNGPGKGHVFQLEDRGEAQLVGRQAPVLKLRDSEVSRRHAEIRCENDTWVIRDLGSTNGTYVNGRRIEVLTELEEGDQILVGRILLVVGQITAEEVEDTHEPPDAKPESVGPAAPLALTGAAAPAEEDEFDLDDEGPAEPMILDPSSDGLSSEADQDPVDLDDLDDLFDSDDEPAVAPPELDPEIGPEAEPQAELELGAELEASLEAEPESVEEADALEAIELDEAAEDVAETVEDIFSDDWADAVDEAGADEGVATAEPSSNLDAVEPAEAAAAVDQPGVVSDEAERMPASAAADDTTEAEDEEAVLRELAELAGVDEGELLEDFDDEALRALRELAADEVEDPSGDGRPVSRLDDRVEQSLPDPLDADLMDADGLGSAADSMDKRDAATLVGAEAAADVPFATVDAPPEEAVEAPADQAAVEAAAPPPPPEPPPPELPSESLPELTPEAELAEADGEGDDADALSPIGLAQDDDDDGDLRAAIDSFEAVDDEEALERAMSEETGESLAASEDDVEEEERDRIEEQSVDLAAPAPEPPPKLAPANRPASTPEPKPKPPRDGDDGDGGAGGPPNGAVVVLLTSLVIGGVAAATWYASETGYVHLPQISMGQTTGPAGPRIAPPRSSLDAAASLTPPPAPEQPPTVGGGAPRLLPGLGAVPATGESSLDPTRSHPASLAAGAGLTAAVAAETRAFVTPSTPGLPDEPVALEPSVGDESGAEPLAMAIRPMQPGGGFQPDPPAPDAAATIDTGRRVAYLVDASGSLIDTLALVVEWLEDELNSLDPATRFTVVFFRDGQAIEPPPDGLDRATADEVRRIARWMQPAAGNVVPSGRSDPATALARALGYGVSEVVILSDDSLSRRMTLEKSEALLADVETLMAGREVTVHTVQFFYRDPQRVLETLAARYGGTYRFIEPEQPAGPDPLEAISNLTTAPTPPPTTP